MNLTLEQTKQNLKVKNCAKSPDDRPEDMIDPEIIDFVAVLNHLGFETYASCEGHIVENRQHGGSCLPYVLICSEAAEDMPYISAVFEGRKDLINEYKGVLKKQERLLEYLTEFYKDRPTPMKYRLVADISIFCRLSIWPHIVACNKAIRSVEDQTRLQKIAMKEVNDFTEFLKTKI